MIIDRGYEIWKKAWREYCKERYPGNYSFSTMIKLGSLALHFVETNIPKDTAKIEEDKREYVIRACKYAIEMRTNWVEVKEYYSSGSVARTLSKEEILDSNNKIQYYHNVIYACDPTYVIPAPKKSGCYVATCVYGSYDCPEVWTLRRFRDDTLGSTWYGRSFIRTYYAISPTLVKWFGRTKWFKRMWRGTLDRMVSKLQSKGVENTPYKDKDWGWK